jgi:hypothetical protein
MILAVEDPLSEAVARKLVENFRNDLTIAVAIGNQGKGYLQTRARELNRTANSVPVFVLIDQDRPAPCPADIIGAWVVTPARRLLFRVAVMEIESWVMADRDRLAAFLRVPASRIPNAPDSIPQPKEFIVNLARRARRRGIREDLVPRRGSTAAVGPAYNARLIEFVEFSWNAVEAATLSPSLARAIQRLSTAFP